jgi:hypothetical protein
MATHLTPHDAQQSLSAHVAAKGDEIRAKYGPVIGWNELLRILEDRQCARYPCEIVFDQRPLEAGEFAYPLAKGARPEDGFTVYVHPLFLADLRRVPWLVFYQLVRVNYGPFASAEDAETFGAHALGLEKDSYYQALCQMANLVEKSVTS